MADCSRCAQPLGHGKRRCRRCGACEDCCSCYKEGEQPERFTPAELGLDPEDDKRYHERMYGDPDFEPPWRGRRR
jgi:hypothetical protein